MTNADLLLGLVEQAIGKGKRTSGNNYAFYCPICNHRKPKLELDFDTEYYHCWTCQPATKGRSIVSLMKRLKISNDIIKEVKRYSKYKESRNDKENKEETLQLKLPPEYKSLSEQQSSIIAKHALNYLEQRGITKDDIFKYRLGYCESGRYRNSIVIPSYDKLGNLNYFVTRTFEKDATRKYSNPKVDKRGIVGFENYINWNVPVILCEGVFDAIALRRNAIPLLGKSITEGLMKELVRPEVKTVYICLDQDALKDALSYAEKLLNLGKEVYLVELGGKDPSEIGFKEVTKLLHTAKELTVLS
jgi:DNA primase